MHAKVCPVGATFISPDGVVLIDQKSAWMRLLRAGLPLWLPLRSCPTKEVADKCTLCYHRITKGFDDRLLRGLPHGARQLADLKNPNDPIHEFLKTHNVQVLKPQNGHRREGFYNDLDGSVR